RATLGAVSRRSVLAKGGLIGAGLLAAPAILSRRAAAADSLVYVSYGGATEDAEVESFLKPFTADTGIDVIAASGPDIAKLKAQAMTGNAEWDVVDFIGSQAIAADRAGVLEKIDYSVVDDTDMFVPKEEASFPFYVYGGGIAYDPARHPDGKHPTDWVQFWDAKAFPGRRGLRSRPDENLELALMADGVPAKQLYPLDVDRAFRSLDRIKPHVAKWIAETPQTISLVQSNEIDFVFTYSGRVQAARKQGVSIAYVYDANIVTPAYTCVAKGTRNKQAAMKLASYFAKPERQAQFCNVLGYSPIKRSAIKLLTPETLAQQPKLDDPKTAVTDIKWWADNFIEVNKRFKEWLLT
ncbi:MAG TPA: ABC transporter substrate-binding protein, partial [Stellaceae bacterium]|nr:ABC transporter substrate-binding protein [Stellaceae bacterium]